MQVSNTEPSNGSTHSSPENMLVISGAWMISWFNTFIIEAVSHFMANHHTYATKVHWPVYGRYKLWVSSAPFVNNFIEMHDAKPCDWPQYQLWLFQESFCMHVTGVSWVKGVYRPNGPMPAYGYFARFCAFKFSRIVEGTLTHAVNGRFLPIYPSNNNNNCQTYVVHEAENENCITVGNGGKGCRENQNRNKNQHGGVKRVAPHSKGKSKFQQHYCLMSKEAMPCSTDI